MSAQTINLGAINNTLTRGDEDYVITGLDGDNTITLGNGNDQLTLGNGNNTLVLGSGTDQITAGTGNNTLTITGAGADTVTLSGGNNTVTLGSGPDVVRAGDGANTITVGDGNDTVTLGSGSNIVTTGNGNSTITVGAGAANTITVGSGSNTVRLAGGPGPAAVSGLSISGIYGGGTNTLALWSSGQTLNVDALAHGSLQNIEVIDLTGTGNNALVVSAAEVLALSAWTGTLRVNGNAGDTVTMRGSGWVTGSTSGGLITYTNGLAALLLETTLTIAGPNTPPAPAAPVVNAPAGFAIPAGTALALAGISVTDQTPGAVLTVVISDSTGLLQTGNAGGVTATGEGTTSLMLTGSVAAIDAELAGLTYRAGAAIGSDWVWVSANAPDTPQVINHVVVTVTPTPGTVVPIVPPAAPVSLAITAPETVSLKAGRTVALAGVSVMESPTSGCLTVTISDATGLLQTSTTSGVTTTGEGTASLQLTGSVAAINAELASLTYQAGAAIGSDWLWVSANAADTPQARSHVVVTVTPETSEPIIIPPIVPVLRVTVPAGFNIAAGDTALLVGATITDSQPDTDVTVTISAGTGLLHTSATSGVSISGENSTALNLTGRPAAVNAALSTLTYQAGSATGADWLSVSGNTANGIAATDFAVASVTAAVIAPVVINLGEPDTTLTLAGVNYAIIGGDGNNTLTLGDGNDTVTLGNGNNTLTLGDGNDTVTLGNGNNTVTLGDGNDTVNLGNGNNTVTVGNGYDLITLGSGINTLTLGGGVASVNGPAASLAGVILTASGGATTLVASGGGTVAMSATIIGVTAVRLLTPAAGDPANVFTANSQAGLTITGSNGNDTITVGAPSQIVRTGAGTTLVQATAANAGAAIVPGTGSTTLEVTSGGTINLNPLDTNMTVRLDVPGILNLSGLGFITAIGSAGADTIVAGATNQTLTGGGGADRLVGYAGFGTTFSDTSSNLNGSTIENFGGNDAIDLKDLLPLGASLAFTANVLSVSAGGYTAAITLPGVFAATNFHLGTDLHGGTLVTFS